VRWESQWTVALKKARAARKPIMVDFWADWCGWCQRLDQTTYVDPEVVRLSRDFIPVKVDTEGGSRQTAIALKYEVTTLPTILFLSPAGNPVLRISTYQGPGQFPATMNAAKETAARVMAWEDTLRTDGSNAVALAEFGVHLFEQESYRDAKDLLGRARKLDGKRPLSERKRTRLLLAGVQKSEDRFAESEAVIKEALELPPAPEFDARLHYLLGRLYAAWGKPGLARAALKTCINHYPHHPITPKARDSLEALDRK
jgi:thioredoxin-like negative regulator of GroEL